MTYRPHHHFSLDDLLAGDIQLASLPRTIEKINRLFEDRSKSLPDIAAVIETDPGLTARLLRIVSHTSHGFPLKVLAVNEAASVAGIQQIRCLVLATVMVEDFSPYPGGLLSMEEYWSMSVRRAVYAKTLATRRNSRELPETISICALLHDIGRLVFYRRIPELARQAGLLATSLGLEESEAQRQVIGFDHYEAGARLADRWHLPEVVRATIAGHLRPELAGAYGLEASIITFADFLAKRNTGQEPRFRASGNPSMPAPPRSLTLPIPEIEHLEHQVETEFDNIRSILLE